jgi:thiamine transport system permease protein
MNPRGRWLVLFPLVFLAFLLVAPVVRLLAEGLGSAAVAWWAVWQDDHLRWRVGWSVAQAGITCALALLLGLPVAWVLARLEFAGRRWCCGC